MNTHEFLELTKTPGRKLELGSPTQRNLQVLKNAEAQFRSYLLNYVKRFNNELSGEQRSILKTLIALLNQPVSVATFKQIKKYIRAFSNIGVNYLVRHPEPLIDSYRKKGGRNLTMRGTLQVWKFDRYLKDKLSIYDSTIKVCFYHSNSKRTQIFALMCYTYLKRHLNLVLQGPKENPFLAATGKKIDDMKDRYPDLKKELERSQFDTKKLKLLRYYFIKWIQEAPLAKETAVELQNLVQNTRKNTINIFFSHENTIGCYMFHILGVSPEQILLKYARFVLIADGFTYY